MGVAGERRWVEWRMVCGCNEEEVVGEEKEGRDGGWKGGGRESEGEKGEKRGGEREERSENGMSRGKRGGEGGDGMAGDDLKQVTRR